MGGYTGSAPNPRIGGRKRYLQWFPQTDLLLDAVNPIDFLDVGPGLLQFRPIHGRSLEKASDSRNEMALAVTFLVPRQRKSLVQLGIPRNKITGLANRP